jgi:hypothetical protein
VHGAKAVQRGRLLGVSGVSGVPTHVPARTLPAPAVSPVSPISLRAGERIAGGVSEPILALTSEEARDEAGEISLPG